MAVLRHAGKGIAKDQANISGQSRKACAERFLRSAGGCRRRTEMSVPRTAAPLPPALIAMLQISRADLGEGKMSGKQVAESREGLFWPTLGLIVFLLVWLGLCTAGFWYLYIQVTRGFSDPQSALTALQWMTWPFVVLAIAGPVVVILSIGGLRIIRDLLQMQKLIINLPTQLDSMQTVLSEFRQLRAQMLTDVSRVRGDDSTSSEEAVAAAPAQDSSGADRRAEHLDEFFELYNEAKEIFYPALEEYNARGGEPLIVAPGGANF